MGLTEFLFQNYWPTLITLILGYALGCWRSRRPRPLMLTGKVTPPKPEFSASEFLAGLVALVPVGLAIARAIDAAKDEQPKKEQPTPKVERDVTPR